MIEFYALTEDEVLRVGRGAEWKCGIAHEDGVLVAIYWHTTAYRTQSCDSCTLACHTGSTPFTREDRRQEGIFRNLYEWVRAENGYDTVLYNSGDYPPDFLAVQAQYNVEFGVMSGSLVPEDYQSRLPLVVGEFNRIAAVRGLAGV